MNCISVKPPKESTQGKKKDLTGVFLIECVVQYCAVSCIQLSSSFSRGVGCSGGKASYLNCLRDNEIVNTVWDGVFDLDETE